MAGQPPLKRSIAGSIPAWGTRGAGPAAAGAQRRDVCGGPAAGVSVRPSRDLVAPERAAGVAVPLSQPRVADMAVCEQWLDRFSQWPQP
jgi:hypothetical protein